MGQLEETIIAFERMQQFDVSTLPRSEELGQELSFLNAVEPAKKVIGLYSRISLTALQDFPESELKALELHANADYSHFKNILDFRVQGTPNPDQVRDSYVRAIIDRYQPSFHRLKDIISYSACRTTDYKLIEHQARGVFQKIEDKSYSITKQLEDSKKQATFQRQLHRMEQNLEKAKEELSFFKRKAKDADGRSTMDSMQRQALEITDRYHVTGLLDIDILEEENRFKVSARKNFPAIEEAKTRFGKQILFTDRESLTVDEIIDIYLDRYIIEDAFRITKSDRWVKMDPVFHWTDSKIRVHALTCMIALLLVRIAHKRARANGFTHGAERMLELLSSVNTAILLYPKSTKAVRIRCSISKEQEVLLTALNCQIPHSM